MFWRVASGFFWLVMLVSGILVAASVWVRRTFGEISVDQLLTNLPGGGGEGAGGPGLVLGGVLTAILLPLVIVTALVLLVAWLRRRAQRSDAPRGRVWIARATAIVLVVAVPTASVSFLATTIGLDDYVRAVAREATTGDSLADFYTAPERIEGGDAAGTAGASGGSDAAARPAVEPRNLVLIYLESIEDALADDTVFEKNMLEPIQDATRGWDAIPSLEQYDGGGWTMAGIVSTQCGIPLRTDASLAEPATLNEIGSEGHETDTYLPGATCLGDVLHEAGYRNVYLGGADARFAGKGAFLSTHGYDEIDDLQHWKAIGETEIREDWGLSDRRLFEHAKDRVDELHAGDRPFNLTMLTLDTHESPRVYEYCDWNTEVAMTSITFCSMEQVAGFIDYLDEQGYLDDTAVVLMGDHRKMIAQGGSFWDELNDREGRTIFNRFRIPGSAPGVAGTAAVARDDVDQFSMYPTILELAGLDIRDHRAGLGVSALVPVEDVPPGSMLDLSPDDYTDIVRSRSAAFFREMWGEAE